MEHKNHQIQNFGRKVYKKSAIHSTGLLKLVPSFLSLFNLILQKKQRSSIYNRQVIQAQRSVLTSANSRPIFNFPLSPQNTQDPNNFCFERNIERIKHKTTTAMSTTYNKILWNGRDSGSSQNSCIICLLAHACSTIVLNPTIIHPGRTRKASVRKAVTGNSLKRTRHCFKSNISSLPVKFQSDLQMTNNFRLRWIKGVL